MNISQLLERNARKYYDKEAFVSGSVRRTYGEVDRIVNTLAHEFRNQGIEQDDRVLLYCPNTLDFVYSYFAIMRIDAIVVPVNAKFTSRELAYVIEHSEAKACIVHEQLMTQAEPLLERHPISWFTTGQSNERIASIYIENESDYNLPLKSTRVDDELTTILYTSGTTGDPKGVMFSSRNILSVATMMCIETEINEPSNVLHLMPLTHSAPLHLFFVAGMYVGATHILAPTFTPDLLLDLIEQESVTHFFGAPVAYLLTAKHKQIQSRDLTSIQRFVYGGAPLSASEVKFVQQAFQSDQFMCVYGLTEAGPSGTFLAPNEHERKAGSIGKRAALNCEIDIVNDNGDHVPRGEVGEIVLRGEGTMLGLYKDEAKTAEVLKDDLLFTGDLAREDEDGYIWVVDRKKDMIISGGVNVYPKEIEHVLQDHPAIIEAAVVGVPHPEWGETIKAFLVTTDGLVPNINDYLSTQLASYKIPKLYEALEELPRNASGKLLKQVLKTRKVESR
ncbi:AMP-binding protein [Geomicrobium sediminis]|uniref:Acyl-CoA synthetase (AMP-forming)/AMP-acid ligase II n=1 Tax=Geomicrobium sediminis TaxID=1347788 RepID=A0ABS2PHQ9_9BACL|nr:acyl-CoA synthetase (AMP-forming)/AMP-acid ligase II [Geomicrobium sediminis]